MSGDNLYLIIWDWFNYFVFLLYATQGVLALFAPDSILFGLYNSKVFGVGYMYLAEVSEQ